MTEHTLTRRRVALGAAAVAGAIGLLAAVPAAAGTDEPEEHSGNPTCGDLAPEGATWDEVKIEPVASGVYAEGTLEITVVDTPDGPTFDWTSTIGVDGVFVKGGNGGNLYSYDEAEGDTGLHAPVNPNNDKYYGLSHISFCYDGDTPPTTEPTTDTTIDVVTTLPPDTDTDTETPEITPTDAPAPAPVATAVPGQPTYAG